MWQAIEQLNYFPNTHARSLVSGRSRILGIIVENITNPFFPELIQSFEEVAVAHGYEILVSSSNSDPAILTTCVRRMLERKVEGVAVLTFGEEEPVLDQLAHHDIPMVLAEFKLDDPKTSTILLDYTTGMRAAVDHLASSAIARSAFSPGRTICIRPSPARTTSAPRCRRQAADRKNVGHRVRPYSARRRRGLRTLRALERSAHGRHLLQRHDRHRRSPRRLHGRTCGSRRISPWSGSTISTSPNLRCPPLTTIRLSRADLARAAFDALRQQAEDPEPEVQREFLVSTSLVVRGSTARRRAPEFQAMGRTKVRSCVGNVES